jgi:hypothetical protein
LLFVNRPVLLALGRALVGLDLLVLGLGRLGRDAAQLGDARAEEPGHHAAEHRAAGAAGADLPR